jgi:hypothetical protein
MQNARAAAVRCREKMRIVNEEKELLNEDYNNGLDMLDSGREIQSVIFVECLSLIEHTCTQCNADEKFQACVSQYRQLRKLEMELINGIF